jgi:protein-tyrosine-phosphatase
MKVSLAMKKTTKEVWAAVKVMRMGDTRVKQANTQRLLKEFENIVTMDGESIEDLMTHVTGLTSNL